MYTTFSNKDDWDANWARRLLCWLRRHKNKEIYGFVNNYDGGYVWESRRRCSCGQEWWGPMS